MILFETERLYIEEAQPKDIDEIIAMENHKENRKYIWQGTVEQHMAEIADPNHLLMMFRDRDSRQTKGFALIGLDFKSNVFEIRRIAITDKGKGYGKEAMKGLIKYAFEETETNRVWLDVYTDHQVGIRLYESLGMHRDGVLRQSYLSDRGYLDQIIYSMLRSEYENNLLW